MPQIKDDMIPFITKDEISTMISDLAQQIENDYDGEEIVIVCPLKGSILFCADLARKIKLPQKIEFVHLTSPKGESVRILKDISSDITGKHVLITAGIIDAGRTIAFLKQRLMASNPASLKIVSLIDKPSRRELPIHLDYVGKVIEDRYVVGYGMDSEEAGRNYSNIYHFRN